MKIPQFITIAEDQSLLENLKGLASLQKALANYAAAEGHKLSVLIHRLEENNNLLLPTDTLEDIRNSASDAVHNVQLIQNNLQSHLLKLLEFIEAESLYDLVPLPPNATGNIVARGEGPILNKHDPCYGGQAYLPKAHISIRKGSIVCATIKYRLEGTGFCCELECVSDGLRVDTLGKIFSRPCLATPNVVLITGYGVLTKHCSTLIERTLCWFALTIWDCGQRGKGDKFRMMILTNGHSPFTYDSGIIF